MRVILKGGIWKNTEDEILKAAVMKYGKNQWARISSLLVRKTPKQCKARWYEWLDPSIKKTDWSKEEDEKLLHLAKLMPTQWRTIAPIVGRTPAQCLERYQKLLDEAESKDEGEAAPTPDDVRKLRPGEIDPDPETKPARPDPIDMDEDEKEMLSEARARLANTQGKKAKRKARERQLDEARRLAAVQKRRELRTAGISWNFRKKIKGMNYNADIPFYTPAPAGFFDVSDEIAREKANHKEITGGTLEQIDGKRRSEVEEEARKRDAKRLKAKKDAGEYIPAEALKAAQEAEMKHTSRKPLNLPSPQVSESELEEIVKIGIAGETAKAIVDGDSASKALLGDYTSMPQPATRTPLAPAAQDQLKIDARNLRAISHAQTPLLGDEIQVDGDMQFSSSASKAAPLQTPNPLARQVTPLAHGADPSMTPKTGIFRGATPARDQIGLNTPRRFDEDEAVLHETEQTIDIRAKLASQFSRLPKPKNDFEIILPEANEDENVGRSNEDSKMVDDTADVLKRQRIVREAAEASELNRRSSAVKKDRPRPLSFNKSAFYPTDSESEVDRLIREEMMALMIHDSSVHPYPGQEFDLDGVSAPAYEEIEDDYLERALSLVNLELLEVRKSLSETAIDDLANEIETVEKQFIFVDGRYKHISEISDKERVLSLKQEHERMKEDMKQQALRASKMEKKLNITLAGYQGISAKLVEDLQRKHEFLSDAMIQLEGYKKLKQNEDVSIPLRISALREEVGILARKESDLQQEYKELLEKRNSMLLR